jgi:hypothetical protein
MPYSIEHRVLPNYLEVRLKGTIVPGKELSEAKDRWTKVAQLCVLEGRELILAFMDLKGQHPIISKFNLVDSAAGLGWRPEYKLALVVKNEEQHSNLSFLETAMNNLGYEMKIFLKKREALKWLLSS